MTSAPVPPIQAGIEPATAVQTIPAGNRRLITAIAASIAFVAAFCAYRYTMMIGVAFLDTGEFQTVTYTLGVAHQTGYPLFIIVGKIFGTLVPIGEWAWRMNLMSVLCVSFSVALLVIYALRFGASPIAAIASALAFAFTLNVWRAASHADPYTLTLLIGVALWTVDLKWATTGRRLWLYVLALGCGVGLGGAAILVMQLPGLIVYAMASQPKRFFKPATMISAGLLGLLGIGIIYGYIPIRARMHPPMNYGDAETWDNFRNVVGIGGSIWEGKHGFLTWHGPIDFARALPEILRNHRLWLTPAGAAVVAVLALTGLVALSFRDRRFSIGVALGIFFPSYLCGTLWANDISHYFLIANWLAYFAAALGAQGLFDETIGQLSPGPTRRALSVVAVAAIFLLPSYIFWVNRDDGELERMRGYREGNVLAERVFKIVEPNAVIFSWWGPSPALWYGQYVGGMRPDVTVIDDANLPEHGWSDATDGMAYYFGKRPIYVTGVEDELSRYSRKYNLHRVADLGVFGQDIQKVDNQIDLSLHKVGGANIYSFTAPMEEETENLLLNWHPNEQPGRLAIADVITYSGSKPSITAPTSWNLIRDDAGPTTRQTLYWHVVQPGESDTQEWTFSQPVDAQGAMLVMEQAAAVNPIVAATGQAGSGWMLSTGPMTTNSDGNFILDFYSTDFSGTAPGYTRPPGTAVLVDVDSPSHVFWILGSYQNGKGPLGDALSHAGQVFNWAAAQVAVKKVSAPPPAAREAPKLSNSIAPSR
ncbi:MAG TPA: DUF2723 domain-containing protein [Candidatus Binataceae bacterium]|nr:DUF2723 domain-containing protein [Candidatus Binataceae bacterium]